MYRAIVEHVACVKRSLYEATSRRIQDGLPHVRCCCSVDSSIMMPSAALVCCADSVAQSPVAGVFVSTANKSMCTACCEGSHLAVDGEAEEEEEETEPSLAFWSPLICHPNSSSVCALHGFEPPSLNALASCLAARDRDIQNERRHRIKGNDPELDPERATPPVPTKVVDKTLPRTGKRNGPAEGAARDGGTRQGGRGGAVRGEAFQQAPAVSTSKTAMTAFAAIVTLDQLGVHCSSQPTFSLPMLICELDYERRGGEGRGRGDRRGRGGYGGRGRGGAPRDDRHSHTGIGDQEKQAAHGWGGKDGQAEWADESAGEAIAKAEVNNEPGFTPDTSAGDPAFTNGPDGEVGEEAAGEPEEKVKSYDDYLKELAEKKLALSSGPPAIRKPNEGSKTKFPEGQAVAREEEDFFVGGGGKTKRVKEAKEKERITVDGQYYAAPDAGDRGGRGGRGGRGRGESRGSFRGEGRSRGGGGGRGRGDRGDFRGAPRGGPRGATFNANDSSAFPALGA
ncbi:hypothetical protein BST61_g9089 [Cercospora zeina]